MTAENTTDFRPVMGDIEQTPSIAKLNAAMAKAQAKIKPAPKDTENPFFKSRYADLAANFVACRDALSENGVALYQPVSATGKQVRITTMLAHESGEWLRATLTLTAGQDTPQAVGSAITYGRRYGLSSMVGIAAEDDDGNAASEPGPKSARTEAPGEDWVKRITDATSISQLDGVDAELVSAADSGKAPPEGSAAGKAIAAALAQKRASLTHRARRP